MTQHIVQRGNNRCAVFGNTSDYQLFLGLLQRESLRYAVAIHAYALMTTHFHLMATPTDTTGLSAMMQGIGRTYVPVFNSKHQRTGGLWEGRYRSFMIEDETYWLTCLRYVELNPVRAGMAATSETYPWSSARAHVCGDEDPLLATHDVYLHLGATPDDRQQAWRVICQAGMQESELAAMREAIQKGRWGQGFERKCSAAVTP